VVYLLKKQNNKKVSVRDNSLRWYAIIFYMNYVYILKSSVDDELYIGSTNDLKRRFKEHNTKKSFSTSWRGPFELVYYEAYKNLEDARDRERALKLRGNSRKHVINRIQRSMK